MSRSVERTVLVVDHDPMMLRTLARALDRGGYRVLAVPDGKAALALASTTRLGAVIADVALPDMSGGELAEMLHRGRPSLHVGIVSASSSEEGAVDPGALETPYPPSQIVELADALVSEADGSMGRRPTRQRSLIEGLETPKRG